MNRMYLCMFTAGDVKETVKTESGYDLVVWGRAVAVDEVLMQ